jgi:Tfp pilus assembly protein PilN
MASEAEAATTKARRLDSRASAAEATLAAQIQAMATAPPQKIVAELANLLPSDVKLQSLQLDYRDRVVLDLRVVARRAEAYDAFLQHLAQSPNFDEVVPGAENREGELFASLRMTYSGGAP